MPSAQEANFSPVAKCDPDSTLCNTHVQKKKDERKVSWDIRKECVLKG
jgi:hypothetical protein